MSCLMLLPVVLLVFGPAGSLVVLWKKKWKSGVRDANTSHVASPASRSGAVLLLVGTLLLAWSAVRQQESTLAIRAVHQGTTMPDGFSIWHHLDAHGIPFKSITPKNDTLLITFDSSDQSAAAKAVLDRTLPHGYIIAQQDNNSQAMQWLTRLRDNSHRFG